jgi:hypothetical protein
MTECRILRKIPDRAEREDMLEDDLEDPTPWIGSQVGRRKSVLPCRKLENE